MFFKGIRQKDISDRTGISDSKISSYVTGRYKPNAETLAKIANALGVDAAWLAGEGPDAEPEEFTRGERGFREIPIVGRVAAGEPIFDEGNVVGEVFVDPALVEGDTHLFALKVTGDSMSPKILDGDTLIVREQPDAENGEIVIVTVDGDEGTCKKLQRYPDSLALISLNPVYEPIVYTWEEVEQLPVRVVGKVIQSRHTF